MGASPGLSLSGDHMAIDADCEHLSAQIEEYILCVGAGAGASGGLTGGWASCPVAIVLVPSPGGWARGELPLLTRGGGPSLGLPVGPGFLGPQACRWTSAGSRSTGGPGQGLLSWPESVGTARGEALGRHGGRREWLPMAP